MLRDRVVRLIDREKKTGSDVAQFVNLGKSFTYRVLEIGVGNICQLVSYGVKHGVPDYLCSLQLDHKPPLFMFFHLSVLVHDLSK